MFRNSAVDRTDGSGFTSTSLRRWAVALAACCAYLSPVAGQYSPSPISLPTAHAEASPCGTEQVTVVVKGQGTGCASAGVTGRQALEEAGFSVTPVAKFPGMICRIGGVPDNTDCNDAPPADSYWAYYHAPLGGDWSYSTRGAGDSTTRVSTVEGWAFGAGEEPGSVPEATSADSAAEADQHMDAEPDQQTDGADTSDGSAVASVENNGSAWLPIIGVIALISALIGVGFAVKKRRAVDHNRYNGEL